MESQLQQLRDAVKAVAKARAEGKPIDLSALPAPLRAKLEEQLRKMPDAQRALQQAQHDGLAKVDAVAKRVATGGTQPAVRTPVIPTYHGHYNNTIKAGDATHVPITWIAAVLLAGYVLWKFVG